MKSSAETGIYGLRKVHKQPEPQFEPQWLERRGRIAADWVSQKIREQMDDNSVEV